MSKQLDELLEKYAWNSLQIQQLRIADKKKLDLSYFSPKYDWEQLREIRLCLEDGIDPTFIQDEHISAKSMQSSREAISKISGTFEEKIEKIRRMKQVRITVLIICVLLMIIAFVCAMWKKDYLLSMINPLEIELVSESEIRGISELSDIHYIDFVKDYTDGAELILPEVEITGIGDYTLIYTVKNPTKEASRKMILIITDDVSPVITLSSDSVTLDHGSSFDARQYISSALDNVDGELDSEVQIDSNVDTGHAGTYQVTYSVSDAAGNKGSALLNVTILPQQVPPANPPSSGSSGTDVSNNTETGSNTTNEINVTAESRTFYFNEYGTSEATLSAAQNYGRTALSSRKANRYTCNPIMQDGVYVGYQVVFS